MRAIVCSWNRVTAAAAAGAHYHMTGSILQTRRNRRPLSLVDVLSNLGVVTMVTFVRHRAVFGRSFKLLSVFLSFFALKQYISVSSNTTFDFALS